jgi:hydroxymethylbilane synthase
MPDPSRIVIGTRGSPLALAQAYETRDRLAAALGWEEERFAFDIIKTTGDAILDRPLSEAGGKGLFTKEIDIAQLEGRIDVSVHSAKDLPNALPDGLVIAGYLPREDVRDAYISAAAPRLLDLPAGAKVGSASLRRQAMIRRLRPDLEIGLIRGNVNTRLDKVARGEFAATLLAVAGLKRLGLGDKITTVLEPEEFLPAVGQGAIAIVIRTGDARTREAVERIVHAPTGVQLAAERTFLGVLEGSCRTPIAGHAFLSGGRIKLEGLVLTPDGRDSATVSLEGAESDAAAIGLEAGRDLKARAPAGALPD